MFGLTISILLWNWHNIHPASHHNELPLYRKKIISYSWIRSERDTKIEYIYYFGDAISVV